MDNRMAIHPITARKQKIKTETLTEEKERMIAEWDYYKKLNGEIDCVFNNKTSISLYGSQAGFLLRYMRQIHKCSLLPIPEQSGLTL